MKSRTLPAHAMSVINEQSSLQLLPYLSIIVRDRLWDPVEGDSPLL